jgi:HPt (histidine-containing phosphotransfer) domain-containing protein
MNFKELADNLGLEVDEYRELIELFIDTGSADCSKIEAGMASHDADQVMRSAHTIKGAAGNLGLFDVSEVAKTIEEGAINNKLGGLSQAVNALKGHFDAIESFVHG